MPTSGLLTQTQVVFITNPRLALDPWDFRSCTEYKDLLRKVPCQDDDGDGISSTSPKYPCQRGCGNERPFFYIVEPGGEIPLQFQFVDLLNSDPEHPLLGWRETDPDFWLEIEVLDMDDAVLWSGDTNEISNSFGVYFSEFGTMQNIIVDMDKLLDVLAEGGHGAVKCFYFRVKVYTNLGNFDTVNGESEPLTVVPSGYTYIDFGTGLVYERTGDTWTVIGPPEHGGIYYVAETGHWYEWDGEFWVGLAGAPEVEEPAFEYVYTMGYRLRNCNESVVRFRSQNSGRDCLGFIHEIPHFEAAWMGAWNDPDGPLSAVPPYGGDGTVVLNQRDGTVSIYVEGIGWVLKPGPFPLEGIPADGSLWHVLEGNTFDPGTGTMTVNAGSWWEYSSDLQRWVEVAAPALFQYDFMVAGSIELESLPVERQVTENNRLLSVAMQRTARLRTFGLPEDVAQLIQAVISTDGFLIDNLTWDEVEALKKNNDGGLHWWINVIATRQDCETDTVC